MCAANNNVQSMCLAVALWPLQQASKPAGSLVWHCVHVQYSTMHALTVPTPCPFIASHVLVLQGGYRSVSHHATRALTHTQTPPTIHSWDIVEQTGAGTNHAFHAVLSQLPTPRCLLTVNCAAFMGARSICAHVDALFPLHHCIQMIVPAVLNTIVHMLSSCLRHAVVMCVKARDDDCKLQSRCRYL